MKQFSILKKLAIVILVVFFSQNAFSQHRQKRTKPVYDSADIGSLDYLPECNGFKQLKLGADIKYLNTDKLAYLDGVDSLDKDSCYTFTYRDTSMLDMGNGLFINLVGLRTYKNKIVNIYLFFQRDVGHDVLQEFEAEYGKFNSVRGEFMYDWKTNGVTLSLRYKENDMNMGVAIFTCNNMEQSLVEDNSKRIAVHQQSKNLLGSL